MLVLLDLRLFVIGISTMDSLLGGLPALPRELLLVPGLPSEAVVDEADGVEVEEVDAWRFAIFSGGGADASVDDRDTSVDKVRFLDFFSGASFANELCLATGLLLGLGGNIPSGASKGLLQ